MAQINKPNEYFNTVLYAGNSSTQSITGVNFQPDLVYIKGRNTSLKYPTMFDSVRGASKRLMTHLTNAEDTHPTMLSSFDSDGWTSGSDDQTNASGTNYVCWNWLAGGTGVSNTDGSITSTVSANTTSGFSVVSYTGTGANATVGHGLGSALDFIIVKRRNGTMSWCTTGTANGWDKSLFLDTTDQNGSYTFWQSTAPTSSVFSIDGSSAVNGSSDTFIAYCFAEKKGFSKFGSYVGNQNSSNGTFVYTGFKPAFILLKRTDAVANWFMFDIKRNTYNTLNNYLWSNSSQAEAVGGTIDFYSNGFKLFTSWTEMNASGGTYIYMAFAENPLVGTNNIPATAR